MVGWWVLVGAGALWPKAHKASFCVMKEVLL
jgi:fructoselysine-6-P-deglycase FrlB-like protein